MAKGDAVSNPNADTRLLLVDDDRGPQRALARVLRHAGYQVDTAEDGDDAAHALLTGNYDTIITDIAMPGMDGIELLQFV